MTVAPKDYAKFSRRKGHFFVRCYYFKIFQGHADIRMGTLRRYPRKIARRQEIDGDSSLKDRML
jgi:hypothetical protein